MIIDFIIEDLMLNSYLQKNFHTLENLNYNNTSEEKARIRKYFSDLAKTVYPE